MGRPRTRYEGKTFGWLEAVEPSKTHPRKWRFLCHACGNTTYEAMVENVRRSEAPTCGCKRTERKLAHGDIINRLTAEYVKPKDPSRWYFRCECGNLKDLPVRDVLSGRHTSCSRACTIARKQGDNTLRVDVSGPGAVQSVWKTLDEMTPEERRAYAFANLYPGGSRLSIAARAEQLDMEPLDALKRYLKMGTI